MACVYDCNNYQQWPEDSFILLVCHIGSTENFLSSVLDEQNSAHERTIKFDVLSVLPFWSGNASESKLQPQTKQPIFRKVATFQPTSHANPCFLLFCRKCLRMIPIGILSITIGCLHRQPGTTETKGWMWGHLSGTTAGRENDVGCLCQDNHQTDASSLCVFF